MSSIGAYNFEGTENFVIENSIIKGIKVPCTITYSNYGELILERMRANPSFVGQIDGLTGRKVTFAEMTEKSVKCAVWLKKLNIQPGDVIGICTHNQLDMYVPCFASLYIGAIYNAWWDSGLTKVVAVHFMTLTRPKVLFVNEASASIALEVVKEIGSETKIVVFGNVSDHQSLDDILATQDSKIVPEFRCTKLPSLNHAAVIIYTSGSTGLPKGVVHSHRSVFENITRFDRLRDMKNPITKIHFSPLCWLSGVYAMLKGVTIPDRRVICPEFTAEIAFQLIEKFKVNWLMITTSAAFRLQKSAAHANHDLSSLKFIFVSGSKVKEDAPKALVTKFPRATVCQAYGSTELGNSVVEQGVNFKSGSCGRVIKNVMLKVIDPDTGKILNPNQIGEACFKCPYMMTCYYGNPEATREAIDSEGWLHTGDFIQYDEEGHIFFVDRIKEIIKYQGYTVSPAMIEQVLLDHPQVLEAAVIGIPNDADDEYPIAFVVKAPNADVLRDELERLVADTLPDYMKLRGGVKFLKELPRTSSGKVARSHLRSLANTEFVC